MGYNKTIMLIFIKEYLGLGVLSIRTGGTIGIIVEPIINPNNLRIDAWYVEDSVSRETSILRREDIRETVSEGFVVDDHSVLAQPEDLLRMREILEIQYTPIGKNVITNTKRKVGKIYDFAVDDKTFYIKKLYASQRFIKSIVGTDSTIDRAQIVEINNQYIVVRDNIMPATAARESAIPA